MGKTKVERQRFWQTDMKNKIQNIEETKKKKFKILRS
jgi:hypothetical protein